MSAKGAITDLRAQILDAHDLTQEEVHVPEWGVTVWVRMLTAGERDSYEQDILQKQGKGKNASYEPNMAEHRAKLLVRCVVDGDGNRIFTQPGDVQALSKKAIAPVQRLYNVATRLNAISEEDEEELLGNSGAGESGDSSSG